jgi:hypothetical protein
MRAICQPGKPPTKTVCPWTGGCAGAVAPPVPPKGGEGHGERGRDRGGGCQRSAGQRGQEAGQSADDADAVPESGRADNRDLAADIVGGTGIEPVAASGKSELLLAGAAADGARPTN